MFSKYFSEEEIHNTLRKYGYDIIEIDTYESHSYYHNVVEYSYHTCKVPFLNGEPYGFSMNSDVEHYHVKNLINKLFDDIVKNKILEIL